MHNDHTLYYEIKKDTYSNLYYVQKECTHEFYYNNNNKFIA